MYNGIILLHDCYDHTIGKPKDLFKKLAGPIELSNNDIGTRVWFSDGECIECIETPAQIAELLNCETQ